MKKLVVIILWLSVLQTKAQVSTFRVIPSTTDSAINTFSGAPYFHFVYRDNSVPQKDDLLVFLTGTNGKGETGREFNTYAASLGYRVINLIYPDDFSLSNYRQVADLESYTKGREEIITGKDMTSEINVDRANSIENRLYKLLIYLNAHFPQGGWGKYFDSQEIAWNKIILVGQSQGGGHAAYIAKKNEVARVIMFASPKDYSVRFNSPPSWVSWDSKTPVDRYYSFVHGMDDHNGCTYPQQQLIWKAIGLYAFGKEANVDNTAPPYNHVHLLTSTKPQQNAHGAPLHDMSYTEAWKYLLTADK